MYLKVKECGHNYVYFNVSVLIVFKLMTLNLNILSSFNNYFKVEERYSPLGSPFYHNDW